MTHTALNAWLQTLEQRHHKAIDMGLDRCRAVAERMGVLSVVVPVITVAGTNGKGSTVATLVALAREAGYRVASYSSPHLLHFNERMCINGEMISDADLLLALEAVEAHRGDISLTYFEHTTLAAFWWFQQQPLDLLVLEIGLGGRLDVVNLINPTVAVITNVGLDHTEFLGGTIAEIAAEKAGIMRANTPVVLGERNPHPVLLEKAQRLSARVIQKGKHFDYQEGRGEHWQYGGVALPRPRLALENVSTALAAAEALAEVSRVNIAQAVWPPALRNVNLPGRLQSMRWPEPLAQQPSPQLILDVAHNPHGAAFLAQQLPTLVGEGRCFVVLAMLADKDSQAVMHTLAAQVTGWHLASLAMPRGQQASVLAAQAQALGLAVQSQSNTVAEALNQARQQATEDDTILVCGSFYTVAAVMALGEK